MKKAIIILTILMTVLSSKSFAQDQKEQTKPQAQAQIKPALLIIDIQNVFLGMVPEREKAVALQNINYYIYLFRSKGYPIIRIYHEDPKYGPKPDTEPFEFPKTVNIRPEDPKIIKHYPDGFNKTDLDKVIRETGSNTLFVCGLSAVGCALATYLSAKSHDYNAFLIKDALMSHNSDYTNNIEDMFNAVDYSVVQFILDSSLQKQ